MQKIKRYILSTRPLAKEIHSEAEAKGIIIEEYSRRTMKTNKVKTRVPRDGAVSPRPRAKMAPQTSKRLVGRILNQVAVEEPGGPKLFSLHSLSY